MKSPMATLTCQNDSSSFVILYSSGRRTERAVVIVVGEQVAIICELPLFPAARPPCPPDNADECGKITVNALLILPW